MSPEKNVLGILFSVKHLTKNSEGSTNLIAPLDGSKIRKNQVKQL